MTPVVQARKSAPQGAHRVIAQFFWVGLGGALGAIIRYLISILVYEEAGTRFPLGTFVINISGSFLIGLTLTYLDAHLQLPAAWRLAIPIGFIGAYTTFSTFEYELMRTAQHGLPLVALAYLAASVTLGYAAVWLGAAAGRALA